MNRRAAFERTDVKSIDTFGVEKPQFEIVSRSADLLRQRSEIQVAALLTTFNSEVNRVAMYAVQRGLVEVPADRTGLPLWTVELPCPCSNLEYEERMRAMCPLNYGRNPRTSSRISPCHHVHSPGGAPTKTCLISHSIAQILPNWTNPPGNKLFLWNCTSKIRS
jgi:hypothetical protein